MILVDAGDRTDLSFDLRLEFADTLHRAGLVAGIDDATIPDKLHASQKYRASQFLVRADETCLTGVIVLGAEKMTDPTQAGLRRYRLDKGRPVVAIGRFGSRQDRLGSQARIAFAVGYEPVIVDLAEIEPAPLLANARIPLMAPLGKPEPPRAKPRLLIFAPGEMAQTPGFAQTLPLLAARSGFETTVVTSAKARSALAGAVRNKRLALLGYCEFSAASLAAGAEIAVVLDGGTPGANAAMAAAHLVGRGGIVVDGTADAILMRSGAPVVRGPQDISQLAQFLETEILPLQNAIRAEAQASDWRRYNDLARLIRLFPEPMRVSAPAPRAAPARRKTVFVPTNGVGLGHAQRCALVAAQLPAGEDTVFAAFPSCLSLIEKHGHACRPLVQKSPDHGEPFANDLLNYRRLQRWLGPGDRIVFDGVYIFDSIFRTIRERELDATWIRRGLWRAHQTNDTALSREHVFNRVIVPLEAFDELNQHYSLGEHIHHVGPIVQPRAGQTQTPKQVRARLSKALGVRFDRLVISMLGGGTAADRGPQLQTICAALEGQADLLHLIVVWPNARVAPELMLWNNTRIVRALDAVALMRAADFVVTAVGYNSFHEVLYHRIPALMIPQIAPYMDDQERRAQAAVERGLAEMVLPDDLLMLDRRIRGFLNGAPGEALRKRLAATDLPEPGNAMAARIIVGGTDETRRMA